ncbi:MAG: hypothetical protein HFI10_03990 [Lachnospiraceae bacterium]|jgi:hypothetical protein|nr:hypothetical protein [Lachnospiraceae bacterium]
MFKELLQDKKKKYIVIVLLLGSFFVALKCIFVSLHMDEEYAVSLSYRLLRGDRLFTQVWDPHQTSAFLMEFLMWIYLKLFDTTTYIVVWVRAIGVLIQFGIAYYLYRMLCYLLEPEYSFYLSILYFNLLPKTYVMPEFSNMMAWGLTMLLLSFFRLSMLEKKEAEDRKRNLKIILTTIEAGMWLSFVVLSYPSCVLLFPLLLWYLWKYDAYRKRTIAVFAGTCLAAGGAYMAYLFSYMTLSELLVNIRSLLASNGSHSDGIIGKCQIYGLNLVPLLLFGTGYLAAAVIVYQCIKRKKLRVHEAGIRKAGATDKGGLAADSKCGFGMGLKHMPEEEKLTFYYIFLITSFVLMFLHWIFMLWKYERSYPYTIYFFIFALAFYYVRKLPEEKRIVADLWLWSNVVMYIAILMLTNLTLFTSVKYLLTGVIMGAAVLLIYTKERQPEIYRKYAGCFLIVWCFVAVFIKGWAYTDNDGLMKNITCVGNIISVGPGKGIVTEYMQGYMAECSHEEFGTYIELGESLLALDTNTICYMYQDVNIGSCTTICTPSFDENLLDYWERNPDKYPDVIAVMCWYGELQWDQESWIMHWIENEFGATQVIDGKYFRYYIRRP